MDDFLILDKKELLEQQQQQQVPEALKKAEMPLPEVEHDKHQQIQNVE